MKIVSRIVLIFILTVIKSFSDEPDWWSNVIDSNSQIIGNDYSPVNLGQGKWMTVNAVDALAALIGDDDPVFDLIKDELYIEGDEGIFDPFPVTLNVEEQYTLLNTGQLKALSAPFYTHLYNVAPGWVEEQLTRNNTKHTGSIFPWGPESGTPAHMAPAIVGQLKAVFDLDFNFSKDEDSIPDLWEWRHAATDSSFDPLTFSGPGSMSSLEDFDADGLSNFEEWIMGLSPASVSNINNDIVGWWKLEETISPVLDSMGSSNSGITSGGAVSTPGVLGEGLFLDGYFSRVDFPGATQQGIIDGSFSISLWYRPEEVPPSTNPWNSSHGIFMANGQVDRHTGLRYRSDQKFEMSNTLYSGTQHSKQPAVSSQAYSPNTFYHLVGVVDREIGETRLYVDGVRVGANSFTSTWISWQTHQGLSGLGWNIGLAKTNNSNHSWHAHGAIDEVILMQIALSDSDVSLLYDYDGDTLPTDWELNQGLLAGVSDQNNNGISDDLDDFDGDGVSNLQEYNDGTDALDRSSVSNPPTLTSDSSGLTNLLIYTPFNN